MKGAIIGDIVGSRFEFDAMNGKTPEDFILFSEGRSRYTDDTVMTIAVAEALMEAGPNGSINLIKEKVITSMRKWGRDYKYAGYGYRFYQWLFDENPQPYYSYGNGSAMRTAAVGWIYDSLLRTKEVSRAVAEVTHNHPEGIKGAECTATVIFLARMGWSKQIIKEYVEEEYPSYDITESLDQLRLRHEHVESCMDSLPKALVCFFEGASFEEVIRNAISLGGDTDTIAAISGSMAEAYYGIPDEILQEAYDYLDISMYDVINKFDDCKLSKV